jgi:hypothetical protein
MEAAGNQEWLVGFCGKGKEVSMANLDPRTPRRLGDDRTGLYVGLAAAALIVVGLLAWAGSDTADTNSNQAAQTETQQPKNNP